MVHSFLWAWLLCYMHVPYLKGGAQIQVLNPNGNVCVTFFTIESDLSKGLYGVCKRMTPKNYESSLTSPLTSSERAIRVQSPPRMAPKYGRTFLMLIGST